MNREETRGMRAGIISERLPIQGKTLTILVQILTIQTIGENKTVSTSHWLESNFRTSRLIKYRRKGTLHVP